VIQKRGFSNVTLTKRNIYVAKINVDRYAILLWSFVGSASTAGWLEMYKDKWDEAIGNIKVEFHLSNRCNELKSKIVQLKFVGNTDMATK
jgi:hypothetical protein